MEKIQIGSYIKRWYIYKAVISSVQFTSVTQLCPTLCDPMNCSTPGFPVCHQLPEFTQTHVHWVGDALQPSHPLLSPSPPAPVPQGIEMYIHISDKGEGQRPLRICSTLASHIHLTLNMSSSISGFISFFCFWFYFFIVEKESTIS